MAENFSKKEVIFTESICKISEKYQSLYKEFCKEDPS